MNIKDISIKDISNKTLTKLLPGIAFVSIVATLAFFLNIGLMPWFQVETLTIAIVLGIIINNSTRIPVLLKNGIDFSQKTLLLFGIVLLGLKMDVQSITTLGIPIILSAIAYVLFVFLIVFILYKRFKLSPKLAALIGVGSGICGAAAVVALAPTIKATKEESVLSVTLVSFLGAMGVIFMAAFSNFSSLSDPEFGIWAGLTLHGVAHAIAGAFIRGEVAGEIGTFVKMTRVLMLIPVSIALSFIFNRQAGSIKARAHIPLYLWGFILCAILKTTGILPDFIVKSGQWASQQLILVAMTAMGLSVTFKDIQGKGLKVILFGLMLFTLTCSIAYMILLYY